MQLLASLARKAIALFTLASFLLATSACVPPTQGPAAGWAEFTAPSFLRVPGGAVNAAGGNLYVRVTDINVDTLLGTWAITRAYNSASEDWLWNFQSSYDGTSFRDASGHEHDVSAVSDGDAIPGTFWVKVDADTVKLKGGLEYHFANGELSHVQWQGFAFPRIEIQRSGTSITIDQCLTPFNHEALYTLTLNADGNPESITGERTGRLVEYAYDASGRLQLARTPKEVAEGLPGTAYEYDALNGKLDATTDSEGVRVEYVYLGGRLQQARRGPGVWTFQYLPRDASRHLYPTLATNPLGGRMKLWFDEERMLREIEYLDDPDLVRRQLTWADRRIQTDSRPDGRLWQYAYEGDDIVEITEPSGNLVSVSYEPGALRPDAPTLRAIRRIEDSIGLVRERGYDQGRLVSDHDGESTRSFGYAGSGLLPATVTDATGVEREFTLYGTHGHWLDLVGVSAPDVSDYRDFDAVGNMQVPGILRSGGVLSQEYDSNRHQTRVELAEHDFGGIQATDHVEVTRRVAGAPEYVAKPYGGDVDPVYDPATGLVDQVWERVNGAWLQLVDYDYDAAGHLVRFTRGNGSSLEFVRDVYGRLLARRAYDETGSLEGEASFVYRQGKLEAMTDSVRGTSEIYAYDSAQRLQTVLYGYGEKRILGYDARGRLTAETYELPDGTPIAQVGFGFDLANQVRSLRDELTGQELYRVDIANGLPLAVVYGNGVSRVPQYDPDTKELVGVQATDASGNAVETTTLTREFAQQPPAEIVTHRVVTPLADTTERYEFSLADTLSDPGKRLFRWSDGSASRSYRYDLLGNQTLAAVFNPERNRLEQADGVDYAYDDAGYAIQRGGDTIEWTATGRIAAIGSDFSAVWDMSDRLVARTELGVTRRFDLWGGRVESDASSGALGALDYRHVSIHLGTGARSYRHLDFRQNVSYVTDDEGQVVTHLHYEGYGLHAVYGLGSGTSFVGKAHFGPLLLLGLRAYDPAIGRFLSPDVLLQPLNQYTYTNGNPLDFLDQSGLLEGKQVAMAFLVFVIAVGAAIVVLPISSTSVVVFGAAITVGEIAKASIAAATLTLATLGLLDAVGVLPETGAGPEGAGGGGGGGCGCGGPGGAGPDSGSGDADAQLRTLTLEIGEPGEDAGAETPPAPTSCSPARLASVPNLEPWFFALLALNLLLGIALLQRRRQHHV